MRIRDRRARALCAAATVLLPHAGRRFVHRRLLGHDLHPTARIGRSFVDVENLVMGEGAVIGSLNVVRGCTDVVLEKDASIGSLNFINSVRPDRGYFNHKERHPALILRQGSGVTAFHILDACDRIELDAFSWIAGFGTLVQTHAVDFDNVRQSCFPVRLGDHSLVSSRCVLLPGSVVPDASIVASGAVVTGKLTSEPHLFAGVPAKPVRALDPTAPFFVRTVVDIK
ncbi:hypothetical protein EV383_4833 [Pseudonocardia sediminis]|uniref:Acetyltransferase-like isoleucine patch superfamily enzyme n=1 Tax=Pseudonocardia sediminis TaxID=1397368 RepID=A0A4Q7V391_PSEST|nr:hypothetical protein [Pseudonocardia sediminis]RZT87901.1 hypothetical protein EV383_4833 [Pseudonocardia sediminis]